jgi:hypothetical protein
MRGFKPKDAAEIAVREIIFENRDDRDIAKRVQIEANDFLRRCGLRRHAQAGALRLMVVPKTMNERAGLKYS